MEKTQLDNSTKQVSGLIVLILLLYVIYGWHQKEEDFVEEEKSPALGHGLVVSFLENNPQDGYIVGRGEYEPISIFLEIKNKGTYPQEDDDDLLSRGKVYVSGFDPKIIEMEVKSKGLDGKSLVGVSRVNPRGGFDTAGFKGMIVPDSIITNKYEPTIVATACYPYITKASPTVCIDPFGPEHRQKKACRIENQDVTNPGAPIEITRVEQEAFNRKIQFKINVRHVGNGEVIKLNALDRCNPYGKQDLKREDFDRIELVRARAGFLDLRCEPSEEGYMIRLFDGEGFVICSLDKGKYKDKKSAYTTPLSLEFRYGYKSTVSKTITILKEQYKFISEASVFYQAV